MPDDATVHDQVLALARRLSAENDRHAGQAPEPVSMPLIRQWCEAIGDRSAIYTDAWDTVVSAHRGVVAPPAMIQVWTMPGLARKPGGTAVDEKQRNREHLPVAGLIPQLCLADVAGELEAFSVR